MIGLELIGDPGHLVCIISGFVGIAQVRLIWGMMMELIEDDD